jgi:ABC-type sugar transport system ATPase subunit
VINGLSGGNQQKSLVSRWLAEDPQIIIMEEPTRGIDVGAKVEMFKIIRNLADNGKSIIVISTEMDELLDECDKIIVMQRGELSGEVIAKKTNKEEIMKMATGVAV